MNVILIGYMGSGKTSLGKKLAKRLDLQFVDTDQWIEVQQGMSIEQIFASHGEAAFREMERNCLQHFASQDNWLISTGGGMPCFHNAMKQIKTMGLSIYLKRPAKELAQRILNAKKKRPLIMDKSFEELVPFIEKHLTEREIFYNQAEIIADREDQSLPAMERLVKGYKSKF